MLRLALARRLVETGPVSRKFLGGVAVALVLLAIAVWAALGRPEAGPAKPEEKVDRAARAAAITQERTAARARGEIDVSPCSAAGRVIDARSKRGLAGAVVMLRPKGLGAPVESGDTGAPITARTDASGDWSVPLVRPGHYILSASADGYLPYVRKDLSFQAGTAHAGLDAALVAGGHALRGTVSDIGGGPVEGAIVSVDRRGEGNVIQFSRASFPAVSDGEGRFVVQVDDGVYQVTAWHADYTGDSESVDVAGGPRSVDLRLVPAASVEGTVRADPGDAPVEGALVSVGEFGGFGGGSAVSDARGRFRLGGLASGAHKLSAVASGHASREPAEVELGIGEALTGVEVRVERAFKISGFVAPKDDPRKALDGVMVGALALDPFALRPATGPSAVDGYFEVLGVRPGTYMLGSVAEQALPEILGGPTVTVVDADIAGVLVELDRGVELRGRVEPPALAAISLTLADDEPGFMTVLANLGNVLVRSRADAGGEFTLRPVKPGKLRVIAEAPDGSRGQLDVEVGVEGLRGAVVTLEPRATVTGRVVDARGAPVKGGSVQLMPVTSKRGNMSMVFDGERRDRHPIAEDGTYAARGLEGGEYELRVLDRGGNVIRWDVPADRSYEPVRKTISAAVVTHGVDLVVELRDGVLRGVVLGPDGAPTADAWVTAAPEQRDPGESQFHRPEAARSGEKVGLVPEPPKEPESQAFPGFEGRGEPALSGEDGRFEFTGLARRTYTLRAEALRGSARVEVTGLSPGTDVRLQTVSLAELTVTARAGGQPVPRWELHVTSHKPGGGTRSERENVDSATGSHRIDHLDPGEYSLIAVADSGRVEHELALKPGERAALVLDLQPWAGLRGVLLDSRTGQPLAGMSVMTFGKGERTGDLLGSLFGKGPRTDATGRFALASVSPGAGELHFLDGDLSDGGTVARADFSVAAGVEADLGTIYGVASGKVAAADRGELGLRTRRATEAARPRPLGEQPPPLTEKEDPKAPKRLWIEAVTIDGPADKAGVLPGDEIVGVDGLSVSATNSENAARMLAPASVRRGQSVTLELARAGGRETVTLEAAERPR
ncbi:carboxypeptidase regulatory-like domain-containing protein [Nannocystis bainbridge]|uniref:Carboxypeptidase regulatory-like domain-containing protein n=1 Tax=Nannocystis bainbridge TaxID=2995303 RepID=A0ABT5E035_9BACT|nr:carboxypeptidase regulatory-like domain-containing protein [Nannocystis bainbridge]MDC0718067.1 carboxypeptidase regulatory-like domain-containing protein [Nannocystis bainbridge]